MSNTLPNTNTNAQHRKCETVTEDLKNKLINQDYTLPTKPDLKELPKLQEKSYKRKAEELREMESEIAQNKGWLS